MLSFSQQKKQRIVNKMKRKKLLSDILLAGILVSVIMTGCKSDVEGESQILANEISESEEGCKSDISTSEAVPESEVSTSEALQEQIAEVLQEQVNSQQFKFDWRDAVNYEEIIYEKTEHERLITHKEEYSENFPIELQNMLLQLKESNYTYEIPQEYCAEVKTITEENDKDGLFLQMQELICQDKNGEKNYQLYKIDLVDLTGDGEEECILYDFSHPCVFSKIDGQWQMLSLYQSFYYFEILEYEDKTYVLCDDRLEYYQINAEDEGEWNRIRIQIEVSDCRALEMYTQEAYAETDMLQDVDLMELRQCDECKVIMINGEIFYVEKGYFATGISINNNYDYAFSIYKLNEDGQPEIAKVFFVVSDLEYSLKETVRENAYNTELVMYH